MAPLEHVVIVGATGTLGSAVLKALQTNSFNITVLTRKDSIAVSVESGHVQCVDYDDPKSLIAALKGADAVVSAISSSAVPVQMKLIDASIEAGVRRFIPSEFGGDTFNEKSSQLPVYRGKVAVTEYLKQKASEGKIEYTAIMTGPFLDFGLAKRLFGFNVVEKKVALFDGGSRPFSTTTLASVGQAVVGVLQHPAETRNTAVFVQSISVSQLELLKIYENATNSKWQTVTVNTEDMEKTALGKIGKGDLSGMRDLIARALFGEGYGCDFRGKNSNALLGVRELNKSDLSALIESVIKSQEAK